MVIWALASSFGLGWLFRGLSAAQLLVVSELVYFLPVVGYLLIKRIRPSQWIPFKLLPISTILMSALAAFLLLPLVTFINLLSMMFATNFVNGTGQQLMENPFLVNLFVMAVVPAVVEELIFRGVLYHAYREKGVILGAVACGLAFGIMHLNLNQFCYATVLGIIFCIFVEITGSIFSSITAHFVINGWNVLLLAVQQPLQEFVSSMGQETNTALTQNEMVDSVLYYGIMAVIATALAIGVLIWMTKHCKREAHMRWCFSRHPLPEGHKKSFVTPCFIIAAAVALIIMILQEILI